MEQPVTGVLDIRNAARDKEIVDLRIKGYSLREIAAQIGSEQTQVARVLQRHFESLVAPSVDELREIQNEQIDQVIKAVFPDAVAGKYPAIDRLIKLWQRKATLNGLDNTAPATVDARSVNLIMPESMTPEQLREFAMGPLSAEKGITQPPRGLPPERPEKPISWVTDEDL